MQESLWHYGNERGINVDNVPDVKREIFDILMNPTGLTIDPNNGTVCINDFIKELNKKKSIRTKYPNGILELDIALMGIREWLLTDRVPWFIVARVDLDDYQKVLQRTSTKKPYLILSIRLPHVSSLQRQLHPAKCLLPELHMNAGIGEYIWILVSTAEAQSRAMEGNVVQNCDLFTFKLPSAKDMEMAQLIKLESDPIDAILVVHISTLLKDVHPAPQFYIAGSSLGWLQWTFTNKAENIPRHIWLQILRSAHASWYVHWQKPTTVCMLINQQINLTRRGCFTADDNTTLVRRTHRVVLPKGITLCICGNHISDSMQTHCKECGLMTTAHKNGLIEAHLLLANQQSWIRARTGARQFIFGQRTATKESIMSEYAVRQLRPLQNLAETIPDNAPSYEQALFLCSLYHIVAAQEKYATLRHSQRCLMAVNGMTEYHTLDLNRITSFGYVDTQASYYEENLGFNVLYLDLYITLQGHRYMPVVEKMAKYVIPDIGVSERAFGVTAVDSYDPVLLHNQPRSNTDRRRGGPAGPYAQTQWTPQNELPDRHINREHESRHATSDEIRHDYQVGGRNTRYLTKQVLTNSLKRTQWRAGTLTIWESSWFAWMMECVYTSYINTKNLPSLSKWKNKNGAQHFEYRKALILQDLKNFAFPVATESGIIQHALQIQQAIDKHKWLDESYDWIYDCPETELRAARKDSYPYFESRGPPWIDEQKRDEDGKLTAGGWTHHLLHSKTQHRYRRRERQHHSSGSSSAPRSPPGRHPYSAEPKAGANHPQWRHYNRPDGQSSRDRRR